MYALGLNINVITLTVINQLLLRSAALPQLSMSLIFFPIFCFHFSLQTVLCQAAFGVTVLFQKQFLCSVKVRGLQAVCETVLKFLGFGGFLNIHKNSTTCSTPLNSMLVPQICHHYVTPPGKLHTVQMQEFFLLEEHWHVFVVCIIHDMLFSIWGRHKHKDTYAQYCQSRKEQGDFIHYHFSTVKNFAWGSKQISNSFKDLLLMLKKLHSVCITY